MCLLAFAWRVHPGFPLVLVGNRDEFHDRPAEPAHWWPAPDGILAGRDLQAGGSWLGLSRGGRFAVVTNYREPGVVTSGRRSRGELVVDFLSSSATAEEWMDELAEDQDGYGGFNLVIGEGDQLHYLTNRGEGHRFLEPGIYGLSNHNLDTPWPKVTAARERLRGLLDEDRPPVESLFSILEDRTRPNDHELPETGVPLEWERLLSSAFVVDPRYGTRASTVVMAGADGEIALVERRFGVDGGCAGESRFDLCVTIAGVREADDG